MDPAAYRRAERNRGRDQTSLRVVSTCLGKNGKPTRILGIHDDPQDAAEFCVAGNPQTLRTRRLAPRDLSAEG